MDDKDALDGSDRFSKVRAEASNNWTEPRSHVATNRINRIQPSPTASGNGGSNPASSSVCQRSW